MKMDFKRPSHLDQANYIADPRKAAPPRDVVTVWAAFLYEGLMISSRNPARRDDILLRWQGSSVSLVSRSCAYLDRIWTLSHHRCRETIVPEGAFEVEVVAQFGELLGFHLILNDGQLPSDEEADAVIVDLLDHFFAAQANAGKQADRD